MTLTEFLLARIAEDEAAARPGDDHWEPTYTDTRNRLELTHDGLMIAPGRVRDECEAKRRIVELHRAWDENDWQSPPYFSAPMDEVLALLALPYADHSDYRDEWRP